jgi:hypothetical protein
MIRFAAFLGVALALCPLAGRGTAEPEATDPERSQAVRSFLECIRIELCD